jgi:hypothetical protein
MAPELGLPLGVIHSSLFDVRFAPFFACSGVEKPSTYAGVARSGSNRVPAISKLVLLFSTLSRDDRCSAGAASNLFRARHERNRGMYATFRFLPTYYCLLTVNEVKFTVVFALPKSFADSDVRTRPP